jgi:hypothetical protein
MASRLLVQNPHLLKEITMADETKPDAAREQQSIQVDETGASTIYANFAQVSLTPEEMVASFGLNTQLQITKPVRITHRVVMDYYTAKRLAYLLHQVVSQHEATFGAVELDAQQRVRNNPRTSSSPSAFRPGPA